MKKAPIYIFMLLILPAGLLGCSPAPTATTPGPVTEPAPVAAVPTTEAPATTLPPPTTETTPPVKTTTAVPAATTPAPTTPAAPPPAPPEQPRTRFAWSTDGGIRIEGGSIPYAYRTGDGKLRLYYSGQGGILSAISDDGTTFQKEAGTRVPGGNDATMVTSKDGKIRLYYKVASGPGGPGQAVHTIHSAISSDGLNFVMEGMRIDSQQTPDRGWASVPDAVMLPDGRVRIYYVSDGLDVKHGIVSAVSEDGLNFTREGPVLTGFVDPSVMRLSDGSYLMLAVALPAAPGGKTTEAPPGIYSFTSKDGTTFEDRQVVLNGENHIDPAIIEIDDGTFKVYYWDVNDNPSAIKSLTGRLK